MKKTKAESSRKGRLAFLPTPKGRTYFVELGRRLTEERGLDVHVTQREAFDRMVDYALEGEAALRMRNGESPTPKEPPEIAARANRAKTRESRFTNSTKECVHATES